MPATNRLFALLGALFLALWAQAAPAQEFPPLTGRVVDNADLLTPEQEGALTQKLAQLETQSGRQLVVATVPSLQGYEISDYGYQLGRFWGIGEKERNDGAILLIAPNEKKVRIEVGYGLEPILTDAVSSLIIREDILPRFRDGDMPAGILAGADRILTILTLPAGEAQRFAAEAEQSETEAGGGGWVMFWIIVAIFAFFIWIGSKFRRRRGSGGGGGGRRYRGGAGPIVVWGGSSGSSWSGGGFGGGGFGGGGGFSGGGGSFGGGGASGRW